MTTRAQLPYDSLPEVGSFSVTSQSFTNGEKLASPQVSGIFGAGGEDISPELQWNGFPQETKSFVVTCFDPDAPTGSGFWHWVAYNIPASVTSLAEGSGSQDGSQLPDGASQLKNDAGLPGYLGAAPPEGHGPHRYVFTVHALNVDELPINDEVTPAICGFNMFGCTLARASTVALFER